MTVCIDLRTSVFLIPICRNFNRSVFTSASFNMKRLILKHRSVFQKNSVSRSERKIIYFVQCLKCFSFRKSVVCIFSVFRIDIIRLSLTVFFCLHRLCRHHRSDSRSDKQEREHSAHPFLLHTFLLPT